MRYLCFDISNLLYRTFFVQRTNEDDTTLAGIATHTALVTLNKYYKIFKPDCVVMAFDSRTNWRKQYTESEQCISKKIYKGNRRQNLSPSQQAKYERFIAHLKEFEKLITDNTTIVTLAQPRMEADDMIAGFAQIYNHPDNEIIIISTDSDLLQLTKYENVKIVSPSSGEVAELTEFRNDPNLYLFYKCLRGDPTDNVQSAYPRLQKKKIFEAFDDPYIRTNLMKETWVDNTNNTIVVEKMFEENQLLIDLEKQPTDVRTEILTSVEAAFNKQRKFSLFFIMKFIAKYELNAIKDKIDIYLPLLSH